MAIRNNNYRKQNGENQRDEAKDRIEVAVRQEAKDTM